MLLVQRAGNCQVSNPASDVLSTGFGSGVDIQCILVIIIITAIDTLGVHSTSARQILLWPWQKDFPQFRGSQRGELSLSAMLSAGAAFQRSFTSQQFAGLWLHGLMVIPNTSFLSLIFKLPQEHTYRGLKKIIMIIMCSFWWPLRQGYMVHGTIRRWNWYRRLEDGRPTLQAMPGSPTSCSSSCPWHYRGGMRSISKHVHRQLAPCNPLFHFLNVLVTIQALCWWAKK